MSKRSLIDSVLGFLQRHHAGPLVPPELAVTLDGLYVHGGIDLMRDAHVTAADAPEPGAARERPT